MKAVGEVLAAMRRRLADSLASHRVRRLALLAGVAYALLYLFSVGHIVVGSSLPYEPGVHFVGWENLFRERAPYNYEPVALVQPVEGFAVFLAVPNLLLAASLSLLLGLNIATLAYNYRHARACGLGRSVSGLLAGVPAFLTGFACCTPTLAILAGASLAAGVLALVQWLMPAALAALAASLAYSLLRRLPARPAPPRASEV